MFFFVHILFFFTLSFTHVHANNNCDMNYIIIHDQIQRKICALVPPEDLNNESVEPKLETHTNFDFYDKDELSEVIAQEEIDLIHLDTLDLESLEELGIVNE